MGKIVHLLLDLSACSVLRHSCRCCVLLCPAVSCCCCCCCRQVSQALLERKLAEHVERIDTDMALEFQVCVGQIVCKKITLTNRVSQQHASTYMCVGVGVKGGSHNMKAPTAGGKPARGAFMLGQGGGAGRAGDTGGRGWFSMFMGNEVEGGGGVLEGRGVPGTGKLGGWVGLSCHCTWATEEGEGGRRWGLRGLGWV